MRHLILFCALCSLIPLGAQTFEAEVRYADSLYKAGDYRASGDAYKKVLTDDRGGVSEHYNAACALALAGEAEPALVYLDEAADLGWKNLRHVKRDKDLESLRDTDAWTAILAKVAANKAEYEKDFDQPLKTQLEAIMVRDQTLRMLASEAQDKFGRDSEEMTYFRSLIIEQDSLNEIEVLSILQERGWVGRSEVGERANLALWLVVQHAPLEMQEKYLSQLQASVTAGESQGSHLALLEDRVLMRNGEPQTYGSQVRRDNETGEQAVYDIRDPAYVDQRRREVGLGPLAIYLQRFGIEWTVEQLER